MNASVEQLWAETFHYAREHSPFYREQFRGITSLPPLHEVRPVDKQVLSARNLDFLCLPRERVVEIVTTSGTTGQPLLWMLSEADLRRLACNERLSFQCAGLAARDTVLVAVAMDRCFMAGLAYCLGLRELGCAVIRTGPASPVLVLEMIERLQPAAIVAVPSFLHVITAKAQDTGFELKNSSIKKIIGIGEPLRNRDLSLNPSGRALAESWGAQLYSTYGVTELANSLCECEAGAGGHLHSEQLCLEVLGDDDRPVADGEVGELVATTWGVEAMPLIRYRTGDCAALFGAPCSCGRTTPRLGPILGRKNQKLKFKGVSVFPSSLQAVLEQTQGVKTFVIIARAQNELCDSIEVLVEGTASLTELRQALQGRSKIVPQIRRASREEIEALQMPLRARKRRLFVDLR